MNDIDRINTLDKQLTTLGPQTQRLKTDVVPALIKQCRAYRNAGKHQEADNVAEQIEAISATIKANEKQLDNIERELYPLRAKLHRNRGPKL